MPVDQNAIATVDACGSSQLVIRLHANTGDYSVDRHAKAVAQLGTAIEASRYALAQSQIDPCCAVASLHER